MSSYAIPKEIINRSFPEAELTIQSPDLWQGDFLLPPAVAEYYQDFGAVDIIIENYGNPVFLSSLSRLWNQQLGYRINAITSERLPAWDDDWLVIADQGATPLIFSRRTENILFAHHGQGKWNPSPLFMDLPEMATSLAIMGEVVVNAGEGFADENGCIYERYIKAAKTNLSRFLDSEIEAETILDTFGWTV